MTLPYLLFHALFIVPPLVLLWWTLPPLDPDRRRISRVGLVLMTTVAVLYTTPWDNYLIRQGVWFYGDGAVAVRLLEAPLGEYLFFTLQPVIAGLWLYHVGFDPSFRQGDFDRLPRIIGATGWLVTGLVGGVLLTVPGWYYLGAILVWACPIVALQWAVGGGYLLREPRPWVVGVAVPTLYLWAVDRLAIGIGIWTIAAEHSTGLTLFGLPIEEAVFFLVTNLLVVYGLVLFEWVMDYWGIEATRPTPKTAEEEHVRGTRD